MLRPLRTTAARRVNIWKQSGQPTANKLCVEPRLRTLGLNQVSLTMAAGEVIDLLSSDNDMLHGQTSGDDNVSMKLPRNKAATVYLGDGTESIRNSKEQSIAAPITKRRKLSPSASSKCDPFALPRLPCSGRPLHPTAMSNQDIAEWEDEFDPIVFTSSLAGALCGRIGNIEVAQDAESDDSLPDDLLSAPSLYRKGTPLLSERTATLLEGLCESDSHPKLSTTRELSNNKTSYKVKSQSKVSADQRASDQEKPRVQRLVKSVRAPLPKRLNDEEKAAKAQEKGLDRIIKAKGKDTLKAVSKEQKAKEKEEDQERKRLLREEKAREKRMATDLAEVNKLRLDKKDSTPEMIVDLPASIDGQSVATQIKACLTSLGVDVSLYQSQIPNVIKWRRKLKARWHAELDHWLPLASMEIHEEKHTMCLLSAKEFVALALAEQPDQDLEIHVAMLSSAYKGCIPIYMIEGLHIWLRKNKTAENRAYQARMLGQAQAEKDLTMGQAASKRKKPMPDVIDEDLIEDALLRLQVMHGCLIHHTNNSLETAEWVANFTQHISTIPYRSIFTAPWRMFELHS